MEKNKEEISESQLKEAVSELISNLPDDTLERAVGGLSEVTRKKLIGAGILGLTALGSAGLLWYKNSSSGEKKSKKRVRFNPNVEVVEYEIEEGNKMHKTPHH